MKILEPNQPLHVPKAALAGPTESKVKHAALARKVSREGGHQARAGPFRNVRESRAVAEAVCKVNSRLCVVQQP